MCSAVTIWMLVMRRTLDETNQAVIAVGEAMSLSA
jgi:hypothetical protein